MGWWAGGVRWGLKFIAVGWRGGYPSGPGVGIGFEDLANAEIYSDLCLSLMSLVWDGA